MQAVLLQPWHGGMGFRCGAPDGDPPWVARSDRPLLLVRWAGDVLRQESYPFDTVSARNGTLEARASIEDGARWEVTLHARPEGSAGFTGSLRWTLRSRRAAGVFVGHRLCLLADPGDLYVCFPGNVYDGNDISANVKDIPRVSRGGVLEVPTTSLAAPCAAFHARSSGTTFVLTAAQRASSPDARGVSTGFLYDIRDPAQPSIAVTAPLLRAA